MAPWISMAPWQTLWIHEVYHWENSRAATHPTCSDSSKSPGQKRPDGKKEKDKSEKKTSTKKTPKIQQLCDFVRSIRSNSLTSCEGPILSVYSVHLGSGFFRFALKKRIKKSRRIHKKGVIRWKEYRVTRVRKI